MAVRSRSWAGACVAAALAAAVATPADARDQLVIGITQYPPTLNPLIDAALAKVYVLGMVRRPLVAYDADWNLVCLLCTELPTIENGRAVPVELGGGRRGVDLTYTIRPDARWGDGVPVTTKDVVFSYEVGRNPSVGVASMEVYRRITGVDVKDDRTFTLHVNKLTFDYAADVFDILPAHLERPAFADAAQYRVRTLYDTDPTNPGLYDGPYRITETEPGSHIVLEPNPAWAGPKPAFRRIVVRTIENTAALEATLLSGGIDMVAGELGFSVDQALAFEKRHGGQFQFIYRPGLGYEHVELNLDNPALADRRVRRALLYGIDRAGISSQLFGGRQPIADSFVNPLDWVHTDEVMHYPFDPAKAAQLLDEAGWKLRDGVRAKPDGERLSLTLMTTAGNRTRELVEQVLQSQWRQLGIDVRIRNEPARVLFGQTVTRRKFQMALFAWISSPESVPRSTLHSNEIPSAGNGWSGQNAGGFRNPQMDRLIDAIEVELDRGKRAALWKLAQQLYAEELPALPLYFRAEAYVLPKWLEGLRPTGHQDPSTLWVEQWHAIR
jgi:peptide/nickel transport system substrate-binding protein